MALARYQNGSQAHFYQEIGRQVLVVQQDPNSETSRETFGRLIERFRNAMFSIAVGRLRDPETAEDVVQMVAAHAFEKLGQLRDPEAFPSWLRQITIRTAINVQTRTRPHQGNQEALQETVGCSEEPDQGLVLQERAARLREGMKVLKQLDRDTLEAFYFRGWTLKKMAEEFDVPVGTIKRRLHVARKRLREVLSDDRAELSAA